MPNNIVRNSRVKFERGSGFVAPMLHLKAFVNNSPAFDIPVLASDILFLPPGLAGMLNVAVSTGTLAARITASPRIDDLSITGSGGYSFSDDFNRADASTWGASWSQIGIGGDTDRYYIRTSQGVPVLGPVPIVGLTTFNTPVGEPALSDAVMQYTIGTTTAFRGTTMRLRSNSATPAIGGKFYQLEIDATTVGSPNAGQLVLWHTIIDSATTVLSVEMARIPPADPYWIPGRQLIPGAVVKFSATVE